MTSVILGPNGRPFEKPAAPTASVGFTGLNRFGGFIREEYLDKLSGPRKIDTYERMRSDGTVAAILRALILPVVAASWVIEPAGKDGNAKRAADLVEHNLMERLGDCWEEEVRNLLTFLVFGFTCSGKNWVLDRGEILLGELRPLHPRTLLQSSRKGGNWDFDQNGKLIGVWQAGHDGQFGWREDYLPRQAFVHLGNEVEFWNPEGRSILRAAYKHWWIKDEMYRFWAIGGERAGTGTPVGKYPKGTPKDRQDEFQQAIVGLATHERAGITIQEDWAVENFSLEVDTETLEKQIQHHDTKITQSVLAQFLQLGTEGKGGAYALSSDQTDLFLLTLECLGDYVAAKINREVIPELVSYNIATDQYPKLSCTVARQSAAALATVVRSLASGQNAPVTWGEADEDWLRERCSFPARTEPRPARTEVVPPQKATPKSTDPNAPPTDPKADPKATEQMSRRERIELRVFQTPGAFRETASYEALNQVAADFHAAIVERSRELQRQVFRLAKLPDPTETAPAGFRRLWPFGRRQFKDETFELTDAQTKAIDKAISSFIADMVGKDQTEAGFSGTESADGTVQHYERLAHAVGVNEAVRLTDAQAAAFQPTRESPEIQALLQGAFGRLSENGKLRIGSQLGDIKEVLAEGMLSGRSPLDVADELNDRFTGYEEHEWERLARTEAAFAANQGQIDEYGAEGVEELENLVSALACSVCQAFAGVRVKVSEAVPGENVGPFHPHCMDTTIPVVPGS